MDYVRSFAIRAYSREATMKKRRAPIGVAGVRDVVRRSPHRITGGGLISDLSSASLNYESPLESDAIKQVACCRDVRALNTQRTIQYVNLEGETRAYTPDLIVDVGGVERLIEVKPLAVLLRPETREYYAAISTCLHRAVQQLDFLTDDQLRVSPRRATADQLKRYRAHPIPKTVLSFLADALCEGPRTIRSLLIDRIGTGTLADFYAAVSQRHIWIDWNDPLLPDAKVALPNSHFGGLNYEDVLHSGRNGLLLERMVLDGGPESERLLAVEEARRKLLPRPSAFGFF